MAICTSCDGLGYREYEAGLIRLRCKVCQGKGQIEDDAASERSVGRIERVNHPARGKAARKSRKSRK